MSDVMTWNWHGNASGMPLGRNGNNQVVSYPTVGGVAPVAPAPAPVDTAETAPDNPPDTPTNPTNQGTYNS